MARKTSKSPTPRKAHTPFQAWFNAALERRGYGLKQVADKVGMDYTHLWKITRGDPARYPTSRRPGYNHTVAIGELLNDLSGALEAAEYNSKTSEEAPSKPLDIRVTILLEVKDGDTYRRIDEVPMTGEQSRAVFGFLTGGLTSTLPVPSS